MELSPAEHCLSGEIVVAVIHARKHAPEDPAARVTDACHRHTVRRTHLKIIINDALIDL